MTSHATLRTPDAPVLALDGPSGSGKGTVGQILADRLGWSYLDSGALYRVVALAAHERGLDDADGATLARLVGELDVVFRPVPDAPPRVLLAGRDVTDAIRSEQSGNAASRVGALPEVRAALLGFQRRFQRPPGLVADGRDMGTVVFPGALLKVFLDASPEVRAERRHKQLKEKGLDVNLPRLSRELQERDERDRARADAPLKPAADAQVLDTSGMSIDEVVAHIMDWLQRRLARGATGRG